VVARRRGGGDPGQLQEVRLHLVLRGRSALQQQRQCGLQRGLLPLQ
jgi:hypothetical protein